MMERKNGMRLPAVVLLAALAFSCFAPAALATAEEPPEDLPAAVSAQDGAQEETTLPGADAAQQDSAAGTGRGQPARDHCHVGAGKPALCKTAVGYPVPQRDPHFHRHRRHPV